MAGVRKALIVATDQYSDPKLTRLNAPAEDARALAEVLRDPDVGAYEVETVLNKTRQEVEVAIASFFQAGSRNDTLLLHFSCHGVKDLSGELYFATTDTKLPLLKVTGVASSMVKDAMEESKASLILCLVDCCYSGAFTKSTKAAATVDLTERLGGRGRAVITASTSLQLALDGQEEPSLFTHAVLEGLRSGEADRDLDGLVTLDEFYNYIHDKVTERNPDQTPVKSFDVQGEVYVARRGAPITTPAPLPKELVDTLATGEDWQRLGAVSRLTDLLNAGHPGRALGARLALQKVRDNDDSIKVRTMAEAALEGAGDTATNPDIPEYVESVGVDRTPDSTELEMEGAKGGPVTTEQPVPDNPALEKPGVGTDGTEVPVPPVPIPWRKRIILGSAAAAAIIALFLVGLWWGNTDDPDPKPAVLRDSELLIPVEKNGARVLEAVDVDSGDHRDLVDDADLPAMSQDRLRMTFIRDVPDDDDLINRVAYATEVDPVHVEPLLDDNAREFCPTSSRPAMSRDGGFVALVCRTASADGKPGSSLGLWHAPVDDDGVDGSEMIALTEDSAVIEAPTWTGQNDLIYVLADMGDDGQSTLWLDSTSEDVDPVELTDGTEGWDSHPDWSDSGVLFLRRPSSDAKTGDVWVLEDGRPRQLTDDVKALWPTWSPDGKRIAYVVREGSGVRSLWVLDTTDRDAEPRRIELDGNPGPPAWSER